MLKLKHYGILIVGIMQILVAVYTLYTIFFNAQFNRHNLFTVALVLYSISLFLSVWSLFRLEHTGRILSITNLFVFCIIFIGGILLVGLRYPIHFFIYLTILLISLYFIYVLTRKKTKDIFH